MPSTRAALVMAVRCSPWVKASWAVSSSPLVQDDPRDGQAGRRSVQGEAGSGGGGGFSL